jgi:hypothetical protein
LKAALHVKPTLTPEQEYELTGPNFSAILPRLEIFKLGWKTGLAHARKIAEEHQK